MMAKLAIERADAVKAWGEKAHESIMVQVSANRDLNAEQHRNLSGQVAGLDRKVVQHDIDTRAAIGTVKTDLERKIGGVGTSVGRLKGRLLAVAAFVMVSMFGIIGYLLDMLVTAFKTIRWP